MTQEAVEVRILIEEEVGIANQRFCEATQALLESPRSSVVKSVQTALSLLNPKFIGSSSVYSQFRLEPASGLPSKSIAFVYSYMPQMFVSADAFLEEDKSPGILQADLLRTYTVAASYPRHGLLRIDTSYSYPRHYGFEDRPRALYQRALRQQLLWLDQKGETTASSVLRKPSNRQDFIRLLLGEPFYEGGTGFMDWQGACDWWLSIAEANRTDLRRLKDEFAEIEAQFPKNSACRILFNAVLSRGKRNNLMRQTLHDIKDNVDGFLFVRESKTETIFNRVKEADPKFPGYGVGKLAEKMAIALVMSRLIDEIQGTQYGVITPDSQYYNFPPQEEKKSA